MRSALALLLLLSLRSELVAAPEEVLAFLDRHCTECHDGQVKKGGLDLSEAPWELDERASFDLWVKVHDRAGKGEMPPKKQARPEAKELAAFLTSLDSPLHTASAKAQEAGGRTPARRLNRFEYENTVQDLLHVDLPLVGLLPEDTPMHGFDTVAEGLRFSQLQIEKYLEAADAALDAAVDLRAAVPIKKERFSYKDQKSIQENLALPDDPPADPKTKYQRKRQVFRSIPDALVMFTDADYMLGLSQFKMRRSGHYRIRLSAYGYQSAGETVTVRIYANNYQVGKRLLGTWEMPPDKAREVVVDVRLDRNEHLLVLPDSVGYDAEGKRLSDIDTTAQFTGRGLAVQWVEVEGPLESEQWPPRSLTSLFPDIPLATVETKKNMNEWEMERAIGFELKPEDPAAALAEIIPDFAGRAFRRPLESGEGDRFVKLAQDSLAGGSKFADAAKLAYRAILTSPQFLLFDEMPGPRLGDHALAARLSYFLWSTLPDEELMKLAADGRLHDPIVLRGQVERLLDDPRSGEFVKHFAGQWLDLRAIDATSPDPGLYPEFDEMLKLAMVGETEAFFAEMVREDLPLTNFIQSDFLMLNSRIARHYGIGTDTAKDERFVRVPLPPDSVRGGLLTQASILKVTANGTVTSPVLRGAWVMKRLLGDPPLPPPPGTPGVEPDTRGASTIREILAKHRNSETCAGCHQKIDPPGFAMESFDVIGGWRERYRSKEMGDRSDAKVQNRGVWQYKVALPVDASGETPDGRPFTGMRDYKQLLLAQSDDVRRCVAGKLLTYATGAAPTYADRAAIEAILGIAEKQGGGLRTLITEIVLSETFRRK